MKTTLLPIYHMSYYQRIFLNTKVLLIETEYVQTYFQ